MSARRASASRDSRTLLTASARDAAPTGMLTKKIHRQLSESVMIPPSSGPAATAKPTVEPQTAIAVIRAGPWNSAPIRASAVANSAAPPMPWSARAASRAAMFHAIPQRKDATVNSAIPSAKIRLRPNRSASAPAVRISAARLTA